MTTMTGPTAITAMDRPHRGLMHASAPKATHRLNPVAAPSADSDQKSHVSSSAVPCLRTELHVVDLNLRLRPQAPTALLNCYEAPHDCGVVGIMPVYP